MHEIHIDTVQQFNERYGFETLHPLKRPGGQREKNTKERQLQRDCSLFVFLHFCTYVLRSARAERSVKVLSMRFEDTFENRSALAERKRKTYMDSCQLIFEARS